ncbi:MAG: argininosuccinate lyase [bacterium]
MKLWGGRFREPLDPFIEKFISSLPVDKRLLLYDIKGDQAHTRALLSAGVISEELAEKILKALEEIKEEVEKGEREIKGDEAEDIHTLVENWLEEKIGEEAGFLRSYRSRNEQIACDLRLYLKEETDLIMKDITSLQETLLSLAEKHKGWKLTGYTHLQHSQPVALSHHLLSYFWMFQRDKERFRDSLKRIDVSPEGAGAIAGVELDPQLKANLLGFSRPFENSIDAVSDRDFLLEFVSDCAICSIHLSRLAEEIVLWATQEFSFLSLADAVCAGSSMMPHKKNPDPAELIRGKTGRIIGSLVSVFIILKGLPLSYNLDMQEQVPLFFDAVDNLKGCLKAMTKILNNVSFNRERMEKSIDDYLLAVELADYLIKKGVPFRKAHRAVGQMLLYALENNKSLKELKVEEMKVFSSAFGEDVYECLSLSSFYERRNFPGGTGEKAIEIQIKKAKEVLLQDG